MNGINFIQRTFLNSQKYKTLTIVLTQLYSWKNEPSVEILLLPQESYYVRKVLTRKHLDLPSVKWKHWSKLQSRCFVKIKSQRNDENKEKSGERFSSEYKDSERHEDYRSEWLGWSIMSSNPSPQFKFIHLYNHSSCRDRSDFWRFRPLL